MKPKISTGFFETMYGHLEELLTKKTTRFDFTVTAKTNLEEFTNPKNQKYLTTNLEGYVNANLDSQKVSAPLENGTLLIDFFKTKKLVYEFEFDFNDARYYFHGEKLLSKKNPVKSMTTLYGILYKEYNIKITKNVIPVKVIVGSTLSHFRLKDIPEFLLSFVKHTKFSM